MGHYRAQTYLSHGAERRGRPDYRLKEIKKRELTGGNRCPRHIHLVFILSASGAIVTAQNLKEMERKEWFYGSNMDSA